MPTNRRDLLGLNSIPSSLSLAVLRPTRL